MALAFGEKTVSKAYLGEKAVSAIYLGTKKVFPDEELPGSGDIRLRIRLTEGSRYFPLFYKIKTEEGGYVSVDWGDGNTETLTGATEYKPAHGYKEYGEYVVKLTGSKFKGIEAPVVDDFYGNFQDAVREILSLKMPTDSTSVYLYKVFNRCANLTGSIPAWDDCITMEERTYTGCTGLTGSIPAWGANITEILFTYTGCTGLTGSIPAWGANITGAYGIYSGCTGLTGSIPTWGANITNACGTYEGCTGLSGNIPAWGANITDAGAGGTSGAGGTYEDCTGLTGCSEELLRDPMPSRITSHADCVSGCVDAIRQHFTSDWGGTKAGA